MQTTMPIIAILMQPYSGDLTYDKFIDASHVKFLELGGARIVALNYEDSRRSIYKILE